MCAAGMLRLFKADFDLHNTREVAFSYVICEQNIYFMNFSLDTNAKLASIHYEIIKINYKLINDNIYLGELQEIESK